MSQDLNVIGAHFQQCDPVLFTASQQIELRLYTPLLDHEQYFQRLAQDIISQQLSVKVADVICGRFLALFPDSRVDPAHILALPDEKLRGIGISWSKVNYVKDLAQKVQDGMVDTRSLQTMDDQAVIDHLVRVKGIGRWTAEMFLIFTLGRPNVFSLGDLGLRRGVAKVYQVSDEDVDAIVGSKHAAWDPYKSYASQILWKSLDQT